MKIGYARVSTGDQTTDLQLDALRAAGCERIYEEKASGAKTDRPQLEACLKSLRAGDELMVWRLDRLGRSLRHLIDVVCALEEQKVAFRSLTESIDTSTPTGKLVFHIFGAMAESERNLIQERVRAGLTAARARGRKGGRRFKLTRRDLEFADKALLDPKMTLTEVAERLGVTRQTLSTRLKQYQQEKQKQGGSNV